MEACARKGIRHKTSAKLTIQIVPPQRTLGEHTREQPKMPSYAFLDGLEHYLRTRKYPVNASTTFKKVANKARKYFIYKDGCLWRSYRGRLLRVVRSDEEVRDLLVRYHDNNNHAGRVRVVKEIMLMYYWVGVTDAVKKWIKACAVCQTRLTKASEPPVQFCLVYGCDASSYINPELSFHRFPKEAEQLQKWLAVAQRDEGSLRSDSHICSQHFDPSCFALNEEGQLKLSPDATPTIMADIMKEDEVPNPSDKEFPTSDMPEEPLSTALAAAKTKDPSGLDFDQYETPMELQEHQYCLSSPDPDSTTVQTVRKHKRRKTIIETSFVTYNHIARYLSHRVLPMQNQKNRGALKRMAKRFSLIDGALMYTRVSPPLRVPRSREEVNLILRQFHDDKGHHGQGICQQEIGKTYHWAGMTQDLANWISKCQTCLNTINKKGMRCSIIACTNFSGPVERGLGLTFHEFPLQNATLLAQWLKATGRPNWHPRLRSSICSVHFTEDCFDRSGEVVTLHPNAIPTLMVHSDSATPFSGPVQPAVEEEAIFAKYDAVELYLSQYTYPPGLSCVEKNTFRRFCKKFTVKDGKLHARKGDRLRLVLRNRRQVEKALKDFHNELNHLDVNKCLRLLNERYFWRTMRLDVVLWINSCSHCSIKKRKKPDSQVEAAELQVLTSPCHDLDSANDDDTGSCSASDGDEGGESDGDAEEQETVILDGTVDKPPSPLPPQTVIPNNPEPRIPIRIYLESPINLESISPNTPFVTQLLSAKKGPPPCSEGQKEPNSSQSQTCIQISINPQPEMPVQPQEQKQTSSRQGGARTPRCVQAQGASERHPPLEQIQPPSQNSGPKAQTSTQIWSKHNVQRPAKKTRVREANPSAKRSSRCGLEPVVAPSTTTSGSASVQAAKLPPEADSPAADRRSTQLQARTIIQQCSQAKVKIRPAVDGADAQWAEIQEGILVYVCFFHGATEDVTYEIANSLMTTRFFQKTAGHSASLLELPGSILLVPQDSLFWKPMSNRRMQSKGGCQLWWSAQLFSKLVSTCKELMSDSAKCRSAGVKVEHGFCGQKQEIVLSSVEPLTVLLEF